VLYNELHQNRSKNLFRFLTSVPLNMNDMLCYIKGYIYICVHFYSSSASNNGFIFISNK
jgi:hypothetical protein